MNAERLAPLLLSVLLASLLAGCGQQQDPQTPPPAQQEEPGAVEPVTAGSAQEVLAQLSTEEKVAQLFLLSPEALDGAEQVTALSDSARKRLKDCPAGGILFSPGNLEDPDQLTKLMDSLTKAAKVPPLFVIQGEDTSPFAGLSGFQPPQVPTSGAIGATGDPAKAKDAAVALGGFLRELGFHLTLAPVADVTTDPALNVRAFSSNPEQAAMMISAAAEGFHQAGLGCTLTHFPGIGGAARDAATGFLTTPKTWQEMLTWEIYPFQAGMAGGADAVLVSHLTTPNAAQQGDLPASLSREMITGKLRGELRFARVIVTDSLSDPAITSAYEPGQAALMAFQAGADLLLQPEDLTAAYDTLLTAVKEGTVSQQRLDESVLRILQLKEKYDLL